MPEESSDHVVLEMAELSTSDGAEGFPENNAPDTIRPVRQLTFQDDSWKESDLQYRETQDDEFDEQMLLRAIADTGRWAYGTISVEAWILNDRGILVRPNKAFWFDPKIVRENPDNEALMRLVDDTREDFVRPDPLAPGVGLAGALWCELSHNNNPLLNQTRQPTPRVHRQSRIPTHRRSSAQSVFNLGNLFNEKNIVWREVEPIANDPDQPYNLRLKVAVEAGIGLAAGVKFDSQGTQGLIMYMASANPDVTRLKSETNEQYLLSAAEVIGSIVSLRRPRHVLLAKRRAMGDSTPGGAKAGEIDTMNMGGSVPPKGSVEGEKDQQPSLPEEGSGQDNTPIIKETQQPKRKSIGKYLKKKLMMVGTKWRGANNQPPPLFSNRESLWTFLGTFLTLLMLLAFSEAITKRNSDLSLVTGPFGALMTLQYSLTAAPASQPRNALLGQTISLSIALGMTYTRLASIVRKALGTALAITCMARLGVTHPPAGAAALIFTGGGYSWAHMGIMLAGNMIAIFFATVINDLNEKRQYPTFWGFGHWKTVFCGGKEGKKFN